MSDDGSSLAYHRSGASSSASISEASIDPEYIASFSPGMRAEVQELYRPDDRSVWQESALEKSAIGDAEAGSYAQECALIVRREPHPITKQVALQSITVQSPLVRDVLRRTFDGFEGLSTQLKQLTFKAPFHPFYYRWHRFERLCEAEPDAETKAHLDLLYAVISREIVPHVEGMRDLIANRVITFEYLWTIFLPGTEVYTPLNGQDSLVELTDNRYGANMGGEFFTLEYRYIDCDGASFGFVTGSVDIAKFDGVKRLDQLEAYPGHLYPGIEAFVDRLYARGEKFEQLNGFNHMSYTGFYNARSSRQLRQRHVDGSRIIIDPQTFSIYGAPGPGLGPVDSVASAEGLAEDDVLIGAHNVVQKATEDAYRSYQQALGKYKKRKREGLSRSGTLTHKQRLLCTPVVRGYCLAFKTWAEFYVENVHQIKWNKNAFPGLVLPHGYKEIIRAFVQEQLTQDDKFDDIVQGKGLGFIMLLAGEPGVGKTLTAESVAEEMHQPLYSMSASELGETAIEVEESLEQVLQLTNKWNAILLLDECDMFLEARSISDLSRNRLVSVFLRQLEYYRGVMFLTSNRVSDFDAAFESRIHLTIRYPPLDRPSRLHIWKTFVQIADVDSSLTEDDLVMLSGMEMNGRQIKNIIKTARLLSKQEKAPLALSHLELVLKVKKMSVEG